MVTKMDDKKIKRKYQTIRTFGIIIVLVLGTVMYFYAMNGPENYIIKADEGTYTSSIVTGQYIANGDYHKATQYRGKIKLVYWLIILKFLAEPIVMLINIPIWKKETVEMIHAFVDATTLYVIYFWMYSWGVF